MMDPTLVAAVVSGAIAAAGTVVGALIQVRSRRPREGQSPPGGTSRLADGADEADLTPGRDVLPDDRR
jgi:hypothetical protein